jgi:thiamine biosynthesis protein ThiS
MQTIEITVNGSRTEVPANQTVENLLTHMGIRSDRVAIEIDKSIVSRRHWTSTPITSGAQIEIVEFVGGG